MPVKILDVAPSAYTPEDQLAFDTATKWAERIPELFITERSKQRQIGISEVGSDCRKCVARKLALVYKEPEGSWFPFIGTAVHDALERGFGERWPHEYMLENRLEVHTYKDLVLGGSCDMAAIMQFKNCDCSNDDPECGGALCDPVVVVNDWKIVGESTLNDAAKGKVKMQYRVQAMLYALGWIKKGYKVTHVALSFLPRDKDLKHKQIVLMRFDEALAVDALARLELLIDASEIVGWDAVIDSQPKASFCYDCKKYEPKETGDAHSIVSSMKKNK